MYMLTFLTVGFGVFGSTVVYSAKYVTDKIQERGYVSKSTPDTITKRFNRTLSRHGFEHFRFHDLRHFAASFQIALGIPPEYIMERVGGVPATRWQGIFMHWTHSANRWQTRRTRHSLNYSNSVEYLVEYLACKMLHFDCKILQFERVRKHKKACRINTFADFTGFFILCDQQGSNL